MGHIQDYEIFPTEPRKVWTHIFRVLVEEGQESVLDI
jgi:hypothetical protein